jgi:2-polyprenyl-3-methyl-5-hydroxy-6-metoxy-1,4-benzoquinol methylase
MNNIYDLIPEQKGIGGIYDDAYAEKYIHNIPEAIAVPRESFILELCRDKTVLHIGSNGVFNSELEEVAKKVYAIDSEPNDNNAENFKQINVEETGYPIAGLDIVLASDILEHLSNPGLFLDNLKLYNCKILISVPNAFAKAHIDWLAKNKENVHRDHVAYYSYNTLKCLVERYGFKIDSWYWYNGLPRIAEGIIFIVEKKS